MSTPADRPPAGGRVIALAVAAGVLAVLCVVLAVVDRQERQDRNEAARARTAAAQAAGQLVLNLDSLSVTTVDADMKRVLAQATGQFKRQFSQSMPTLKRYVQERQIRSKGELKAVGVVRSDPVSATVIVAVDRTFQDKTTRQGVVQRDRWKLSLEKRGGTWLVAELDPVA